MIPAGSPACTMRTLAAALRLSVMTVSRALRNADGIAVSTRERVLAAARRHGYRPDPALAVLNTYRHGRRRPVSREKIAFVTNFPTADGWRGTRTFVRYLEGAQQRALALGYEVEPFWLGAPDMTNRRASQILRGRGIRGIIVGPLVNAPARLSIDWTLFSAVAVGRSLSEPGLTAVSTNHFQALERAWDEVWRRGYRRIGLVLTESENARTTGALLAAYLLQQSRTGGERLSVLLVPDFSGPSVAAWCAAQKPDVILSSEQAHYDLLCTGRQRPRFDFVHLNMDPTSDLAGIDQAHDVVGEHATALLHLKLLQRETGVPARRDLLLIDAIWKEGRGPWRLSLPRSKRTPGTA